MILDVFSNQKDSMILRNTMQQHSPQFDNFFIDNWADKADTIHIKCAHWTASFCNSCSSRPASGKAIGWQTFGGVIPSGLCSEADAWWACLESRDGARLVRFSGWGRQPQKPLEGQQGLAHQFSREMTVSCLGVPSWGWHSQISRRAWEEHRTRATVQLSD